jgi:asparagine synthase (glutamine-hydrolysing)
MSGICGIQSFGRPASGAFEQMLSGLAVRNQHTTGSDSVGAVSLGAVRGVDDQSVSEHDGLLVAVDADLVELAAMKAHLAQHGVVAGDASLADLVRHLYRLHDLDFAQHLSGAFAIAIWDNTKQRLVLAIDRIGIKSLYWSQERDRFCFGSRLSSVLAGRHSVPDLNPAATINYLLFSMVPAPITPYLGIAKMTPGHFLICERNEIRHQSYWDARYEESRERGVAKWAQRLREAMRSSVHRHLEGCEAETSGAFLSGGTDSSSVVAFTNEWRSPVNTFSIFFEDEQYSEINYARTTALRFKTRHFERALYAPDATACIDLLADYYDEPFANSSAIGSYYCAVMAKEQGVTTLLAGDGGDELFGGNQRYADDKLFQLFHEIPGPLRSLVKAGTQILPRQGKLSLPARYVKRAQIPNPRRVLSYSVFLENPAADIFESGFLEEVPPSSWLSISEGHFQRAKASTELNRHLYMDLKMTLADNDLRKVQCTAELAGIKVRYPLLDHVLVEFSTTIPTRLKLKGFEKRYLFKQAMTGILPETVLYKKKHGFGVPVSKWLLHDPALSSQMRDVLADKRTQERGYFKKSFVNKLSDLHQKDDVAYHGEILWYLLILELWQRRHVDARRQVPMTG